MPVSEKLAYSHEGFALEGIIFRPEEVRGNTPGLLLIHEFTGLGEHIFHNARLFTQKGFTVLCCDMYGKDIRPQSEEEALKLARIFRKNRPLMAARAAAGLSALKNVDGVAPDKVSAAGYSFGGCAALELARSGADIKSAVSFYGYLNSPATASRGQIKARILVLHGVHDKVVPLHEVEPFALEMKNAGVKSKIVLYPEAGHGFSNPHIAYNEKNCSWYCPKTAEDALNEAMTFIAEKEDEF